MTEGQTEQRSIKKISEADQGYRSRQEQTVVLLDPAEYAFGYDVHVYRKHMDRMSDSLKAKFESGLTKKLGNARVKLQSQSHNPRSAHYFIDFIGESLLDSDTGLTSFILRRNEKPDFQKIFAVSGISDKVLEQMIVAHVKRFEDNLSTFDTQVQTWQSQFDKRLREKIASGSYPLSIEVLERRLQNTKVVLGDALRDDLTSDKGGHFEVEREIAMIAQQELRRRGEKVYTHEMLHALSGRTLVAEKPKNPIADDDENYYYNAQRVGLRFQSGESSRFRWLNEGVTESLTQDICTITDTTYEKERELFKLLQQQGKIPVSEELFIKAFFENYNPDLPYGERIPAWKHLYSAINNAYVPGFLLKLDKYVGTNGIEKTIDTMKGDWREIIKTS